MDSLTIATWVLAAVTLVYACLTFLILRQNRELVARQTKPEVIAFLEATSSHVLHLVVQNVGAGVARNVRVDVPRQWTALPDLGSLGDIGFVAKGLAVLPSGARTHSMIAMLPRLDMDSTEPIPTTIHFDDAQGKHYSSCAILDVTELLGIRPGSKSFPGSLIGV